MQPNLAAVVEDLLSMDPEGTACFGAEPPERQAGVMFVSVPRAHRENGSRQESRKRNGRPGMARGAGLELDLSAPSGVDRIPAEYRVGLPRAGFVNYVEARAVVRLLEQLSRQDAAMLASVAILALYEGQAELIRRLVHHSPLRDRLGGTPPVGLPREFRHREAAVVFVSLTRSNAGRGVPYGDDSAGLTLALTRARRQLILVGDPGTLARRSQWQGVVDHRDEPSAARENLLITRLVRYLEGQGRFGRYFQMRECPTGLGG
jgi:hypothetical protein